MNKYITSFTTTEEFNTSKSSLKKPHVSLTKDDMKVHYMSYDYSDRYLTFVALESGTIDFILYSWADTTYIESIAYSKNNDEWVETQNSDDREEDIVISVNVVEGDKVRWKGIANHIGGDDDNGGVFTSTHKLNVQGNIMSLLYGDNFIDKIEIENNNAFTYLFYSLITNNSCRIVNALNLSLPATTLTHGCYWGMFYDCASLTTAPSILPATTLANYCYSYMFNNCTSLTTTPELPATTLEVFCYFAMFYGCSSLTTAPELPATTLANYCYRAMFQDCTSLTIASELPTTTLAEGCYQYMFYNCSNLITAPKLPAITLVNNCYAFMFNDCTSLTTAPELPATELANNCYDYMFNGCTNLNYIKAMFTTEPNTTYTNNWVSGVASSGTFVKNSAATWTTTGVSGIPVGWTIASQYDYAGHDYVDLGLPSGTKWATMNVGANSETDYGNYYQYGKGAAQYAATSGQSDYSGTESPLATTADTAAQEWGGSWHMPTQAQLNELTANTTYEWTTINGVNGGKFTAKNGSGNYIFIPAAGFYGDGILYDVGTGGYVWSSTPDDNSLYFADGGAHGDNFNRRAGFSVRGVVG